LGCKLAESFEFKSKLMDRTKLPIQARLIRAGIYALLVAMSYWVCRFSTFLLANTIAKGPMRFELMSS